MPAQWRLRQTGVVNRSCTYEKVRFTVTAPTTSFRLLSIRGDYCAYVYVASGNTRSEIHGSVTGLTRRNAFEAGFVFVAERTEDWNGSQRKRSDRGSSFTYSILPWLNRCRVGVRTSKKEVMMLSQFSRRM